MIDLYKFNPADLAIAAFAAGAFTGAALALVAGWLRWGRSAFHRGCAHMENLFRDRIATDTRDDSPLPPAAR